jgi:hypothetical protein
MATKTYMLIPTSDTIEQGKAGTFNKKISVIKSIREHFGYDLKGSKDIADQILLGLTQRATVTPEDRPFLESAMIRELQGFGIQAVPLEIEKEAPAPETNLGELIDNLLLSLKGALETKRIKAANLIYRALKEATA